MGAVHLGAVHVVQTAGMVLLYPSSPKNLKVTTPLDLRIAELLLAERGTR